MNDRPSTLGELKEAGYRPRGVRDEIRGNLIAKVRSGENVFPGILGYERTVIPALVNALLAQHDIILLGLRGQAKTRILRALVSLLDEWMPALAGSPLRESPFAPFTAYGRRIAASGGTGHPGRLTSRPLPGSPFPSCSDRQDPVGTLSPRRHRSYTLSVFRSFPKPTRG